MPCPARPQVVTTRRKPYRHSNQQDTPQHGEILLLRTHTTAPRLCTAGDRASGGQGCRGRHLTQRPKSEAPHVSSQHFGEEQLCARQIARAAHERHKRSQTRHLPLPPGVFPHVPPTCTPPHPTHLAHVKRGPPLHNGTSVSIHQAHLPACALHDPPRHAHLPDIAPHSTPNHHPPTTCTLHTAPCTCTLQPLPCSLQPASMLPCTLRRRACVRARKCDLGERASRQPSAAIAGKYEGLQLRACSSSALTNAQVALSR